MNHLLDVFAQNILPVFLCAGAGLVLGRTQTVDRKTLTQVIFYIFSPSLVFHSLTETRVDGAEFGALAAFTLGVVAIMTGLAGLAGLLLRADRRTLATLVIASAFVNGGNYGLAATRFAFGDAALARAVIYFVFSTIGVYTLGVFVASLGRQSPRQALREIVSVPAFYALAAAGLVRAGGWTTPTPVARAVELLGEASIPAMLVLLGLQLAAVRWHAAAWPRQRVLALGAATVLQLLVAPLVALALAAGLALTGATWQAAVLEASMPAAVITMVLAVQYDLDADLMTAAVLATTLLSPVTLTPLIIYLQSAV